MTLFSAHFVGVLACVCAVLPLASPVEAAHLHVSRKHATSPPAPHHTHPSSFHGSTPAHKHDGGHRDHKEHQPRRLPPLLQRYRAQNYNHVHDQGLGPHDDKISSSAFARSRYRREHSRRSSVYVPGEHGNTYIVSRTPPRVPRHASTSHAYGRRQVDGNNLASGRIDIMGAAQSSERTQRLASLSVDSTPINWMSGQSSAKAFPLNASTTNRTQFMMVPTNDSDTGGMNKHVRLATQVFDAGSADMIMYCATYDANPETPSALLMTPCANTAQFASSEEDATGSCADDGDDASSSTSQQSQIFSYNPISGVVGPILATEGSSDISAACAGAKVRRDTNSATTSGSATPSSTSTSTAPIPNVSQHAQNVTLVYVAGVLEVPASPSSGVNSTIPSTSATPSAHMNEAAVVTTTVTTTVITTVVASGTVSPALAVASAPTSSTVSASTSTSTTTTSPISSSTTSSGAAVATHANPEESLEVEVVGVTSSTRDSTPTPTTTSSSTSHTATPTLDPEAVASLMVEQMPHRWRAIALGSASTSE